MFAIQIRHLIEVAVTAGESPKLRVVVPATNFEQTGITVVTVTRCRRKLIATCGAATRGNLIAKGIRVDREGDSLAAAGLGSRGAKSIAQWIFTVLAKEGVSVTIRRGRGRSLLLQQHGVARILVGCGSAAHRSADASACSIIGKAGCGTPLRDAGQLAIVIIRQGVGRTCECPAGLLAIGVVAVAVIQSTG